MKLADYLAKEKLSQEEFGRRIPVSQGMVWQWLEWLENPQKGTRITAERALDIERASHGEVARHELRPDLFGGQSQQTPFDEPDLKAEVARIVALTSRGEREFHLLRLPSALRADVEAELVLALASRMYEGTETRETLPAWLTESVLDKAGVRPEKRAANG